MDIVDEPRFDLETGASPRESAALGAKEHADFENVPAWLDEAMASLYERSLWQQGALVPLPNWRLNGVVAEDLDDLAIFNQTGDDNSLDYFELSALRMLMLYLESRDELAEFYSNVKSNPDLHTAGNAIGALNIDPVAWRTFIRQSIESYQADRYRDSPFLTNPDEVKYVQNALNRILGTNHSVDGFWGSTTERQVRKFRLSRAWRLTDLRVKIL
jgi:hypothetical protein